MSFQLFVGLVFMFGFMRYMVKAEVLPAGLAYTLVAAIGWLCR